LPLGALIKKLQAALEVATRSEGGEHKEEEKEEEASSGSAGVFMTWHATDGA